MAEGSWYEPNAFEGAAREEERRALANLAPDRLWMPNGESKEVVVIDDDPFKRAA